METLNAFLGSALGTIVVCVIAWTAKEVWSRKKDRDKLEHEVRFKKVYDQMSDTLIKLAPMLMKATKDFRSFINDLEWSDAPSKLDQWKTAATSYNETRAFLHDNRLLIPKPIFNQADEFVKALKAMIDKYSSAKRRTESRQDGEPYQNYTAIAEEALKALEPRYLAIHDAMQTYLGVPIE